MSLRWCVSRLPTVQLRGKTRVAREEDKADKAMHRPVVVIKNVVLLVVSTTIGRFLPMVVVIVMARLLGAGEFGLFGFAKASARLLTLIPSFGFNPLVARDVAKDSAVAGQLLGDILVLKFALSAIVFLFFVAVPISLTSTAPTRNLVILLALCGMVAESFLDFFSSFYRAYQVSQYEAAIQVSLAVFHTVGGLTILYLGYGLIAFLLWHLAGDLGAASIAYVVLRSRLVRPIFALRFSALVGVLRRALPMAVGSIFIATYVRIDVVLLSYFKGDMTTGWYFAAQRPIAIFAFLPVAFMGAILPAMSQSGHTTRSLSQYFEQTVKYLLILSLPLAIGVGLLADRIILLLYGQAYESAIPALQVLAWVLVAAFVNHGIATTLLAVGREKKFMIIAAWGVAFNVLTNLVCIPLFGHVGASLTTLASEILVCTLGFREVRRHIKDLRLFLLICKALIAGVVMGGVVLGIREQSLPLLVGLAAVCYLGALLLVGLLQRKELALPIRPLVMMFKGQ